MKSEVLIHFQFIGLTCGALLLFFLLFAGALIWIFLPQKRTEYAQAQAIPFRKDVPYER